MRESLRRAFTSFLAIPTALIVLFGALAVGSFGLDQATWGWIRPIQEVLRRHLFRDAESTSALLETIAGGTITVTSITFSLLLLALQQSAGSMTHDVFDQFLHRRANQVYVGFFVGLPTYVLIVLTLVEPPFNPVLGATLALLLTITGLYALLLLVYSTITEMRPTEIIHSIHDYALLAREKQLDLIQRTRRSPELSGPVVRTVLAPREGYLATINLGPLASILASTPGQSEVVYLQSIGAYVAFGDPIADIRVGQSDGAEAIAACVEKATTIAHDRDFDTDPGDGIAQITTIGWRSISTSQQNPQPGITAVNALRDLLARWSVPELQMTDRRPLSVVYPDNLMDSLLDAFGSLAVVASESMQHQTYAAILSTFAITFERLSDADRDRANNMLLRTIAGLGDHVLTAELDDTIQSLIATLERANRPETAARFRVARDELARSIGVVNSRATRVPGN